MTTNNEWTCEHCLTRNPSHVQVCMNPDLDRLAIRRYEQGVRDTQAKAINDILEMIKAYSVLSQYGQVVVNTELNGLDNG